MKLSGNLEGMWKGFMTPGYVRRGKYIQRDQVPFQQVLPIQLRKVVGGGSGQLNSPTCVQEMSVMFACLKNNEFNEIKCPQEIAAFKKCYTANVNAKKFLKEQAQSGVLAPGTKTLTQLQANALLKQFP